MTNLWYLFPHVRAISNMITHLLIQVGAIIFAPNPNNAPPRLLLLKRAAHEKDYPNGMRESHFSLLSLVSVPSIVKFMRKIKVMIRHL